MKILSIITMLLTSFLLIGCLSPEQIAQKEAEKEAEKAAAQEAMIAEAQAKLPEGYTRVTGDALVDYFTDKTSSGLAMDSPGWSYVVYREAGGVQRGISKNGSETSKDSGRWEIRDDLFCSKWTRWQDGQERCHLIFLSGDNEYSIRADTGTLWSSVEQKATRVDGNPSNL